MARPTTTRDSDDRGRGSNPRNGESLRKRVEELLEVAFEREVENFLDRHRNLKDDRGRQRLVRNGYLPEREIQTPIGAVKVRVPRVRDRGAGLLGNTIRFQSRLVKRYLRRRGANDELLQLLADLAALPDIGRERMDVKELGARLRRRVAEREGRDERMDEEEELDEDSSSE